MEITIKIQCFNQTYTFDAVAHISNVICVLLDIQKSLDETLKHQQHPSATICR